MAGDLGGSQLEPSGRFWPSPPRSVEHNAEKKARKRQEKGKKKERKRKEKGKKKE
jgi:hypothetical protein